MIEFLEEEHIYLKDGVIVPSVSQILHFIFPDKYKNVPKNILNAKANYGTKVHESIEAYEEILGLNDEYIDPKNETISWLELNTYQEIALSQYIELKEKNNIEVIEQEQMISYEDKYCGRFDMVANVNGEYSLCDIKTTSVLDKKYLSWQLSMYELGTGKQFNKLYAIWIPKKELAQLVEIERISKEEILKKLEEYYENA